MNKVFLIGYLAADPKQRITSKGIEQSIFNIGVTDMRNYNESYFFPCVAWNNQAKYINTNLKKGSFVSIDGHLTRRSYVDSEGKTVYLIEVVIDNIRNYNTRSSNSVNNNVTVNNTAEEAIMQPTILSDILEVTKPSKLESEEANESNDFDWEKELE